MFSKSSFLYVATASDAPCITASISMPAAAIGRRPTGVRTEKRPPTSSGITKVS